MTPWQKELIKSMMISWDTFEYFCKKQKNKKMLNGYLNRLFPEYKTHDKKYKKLNIGIEFEYDHILKRVMSRKEIQSIVDNNIYSFSSGWDGCGDDYNVFNQSKKQKCLITLNTNKQKLRSNEDRIRLIGYKGLKSLYKYLIYLNTFGRISKNASVHLHIDCYYDNSFEKLVKKWSRFYESKEKTELTKYLKCIKKPSLLKISADCDNLPNKIYTKTGKLKNSYILKFTTLYGFMSSDHCTIEYRNYKASYRYEDIVTYILISIYLTKCYKSGANINEDFIKNIIDIRDKIKNPFVDIIK